MFPYIAPRLRGTSFQGSWNSSVDRWSLKPDSNGPIVNEEDESPTSFKRSGHSVFERNGLQTSTVDSTKIFPDVSMKIYFLVSFISTTSKSIPFHFCASFLHSLLNKGVEQHYERSVGFRILILGYAGEQIRLISVLKILKPDEFWSHKFEV